MQRSLLFHLAATLLIGAVASGFSQPALADDSSLSPDNVTHLVTALDELDQWIGEGANGDRWRKYLATGALRKQIEKGKGANPAVVATVLNKYRSRAKGLDKYRFVAVRRQLELWLAALKQQYADDLPKMAWAARGDYQAVSRERRLGAARDELRARARDLERALGGRSPFAQAWRRYLKWELLEPHFSNDVKIDSQSLEDLRVVLRRFRSNQPGLENPVFTKMAGALQHYRGLYGWYELVGQYARKSRKKYSASELERRVYILQLAELEKQLTRHEQAPTVETTRKVGQLLGLIEQLGQSPQLVQAIRSRFAQANVTTEISENAINRIAGRPINETQPVRDFILGARIRGRATSTGQVSFRTLPADGHIEIEVCLSGNIQSDTVGHRKPVQIFSHGSTDFIATKRLEISDERFVAMPANVSAYTKTRTRSISKTGGQFGRRFVERIAWKKVCQSKRQSESIASGRAKKRVAAKFDSQLVNTIFEARRNYDTKLRSQLVRIGLFPEDHHVASTEASVNVQATLASFAQVSTDSLPPELPTGDDLTVRIHETAVNNYLPTLLAGVGLRQDNESDPPTLEGDVPSWLKKLAKEHGGERKLSVEAGNAVEQGQKSVAKDSEGQTAAQQDDAKDSSFEFKPYSLRLNRTHPLSIRFDDQKLTLRVRIAELKTIEEGEETLREDWDFVISFQVLQNDNGILLRRIGDIEAFPTGFDPNPRWGDRLTSEQVATRGALAKVLKKRAASSEGFPTEISVPAIRLPSQSGIEQPLVLKHLHCDDGWLTIGYQLP